MADVDGSWDCTVKSPLGDQKMTVVVKTEGSSWNGTVSGAMGSSDLSGEAEGNTISWKQQMTVPMPMTLDCKATAEGDTLTGMVGAARSAASRCRARAPPDRGLTHHQAPPRRWPAPSRKGGRNGAPSAVTSGP